jgi:hypothetical protein
VSVFRPSVRLTAPDGTRWEIYAYRIQLRGPARRGALRLLAAGWSVPRAAIRSLRSDEWTIEAVSWDAHRRAIAWRTTGEFRGNVLAQVEGQLARGEYPVPRHAALLARSG